MKIFFAKNVSSRLSAVWTDSSLPRDDQDGHYQFEVLNSHQLTFMFRDMNIGQWHWIGHNRHSQLANLLTNVCIYLFIHGC